MGEVGAAAGGEAKRAGPLALGLATLGVVFGDIGTSPLYALREAFFGPYAVAPTQGNVFGVLSLIFWSLVLVISVKYLAFILRADNRGEGGILALLTLVHPEGEHLGRRRGLVLLGLFGAALLYGDGMITPAISVLSAVEGLEVATHVFEPFVIPITVGILVGLFLFQRHGTSRVGAVFGPVTLAWFLALAALGALHVAQSPEVLRALHPGYALAFLLEHREQGFFVLGAVFLVVTGGEALYADMGHFGARPIRATWFLVVLPALVLNYFGQGALLLASPEAAAHPFYHMAPSWALLPLVVLATSATIVASQAMISGAFSLTVQAIHLGYAPRLRVRHTSASAMGQIYVPLVNWALMVASIGLVLAFGSSSALAAAYGLAVSADMVITTLLFAVVARTLWRWPLWTVALVVGSFLAIDLAFFGANALKFFDGGWFPLVVGALVFTLMTTWRKGRRILAERIRAGKVRLEPFLARVRDERPHRARGTAVFLTSNPEAVPNALLRNLEANGVIHERVVLLSFLTEEVPRVADEARVDVQDFGQGAYRVVARHGFMEDPHAVHALELARAHGFPFRLEETTFFVGRERIVASHGPGGMLYWREQLFGIMARNAQQAAAYFQIPSDRVIEIGSQVEL